ncbi:MAG: hypothetical protein QG670_725 [Thermoproteota archaeon]|nr:hypothetical protein [Thermoproteota archaeon]
MSSFQEDMKEYRKQLEKGTLQRAYQGLMEYLMGLRAYFEKKHPTYSVSGSIYQGYMDMTYFSFFPDSLKRRRLKVGIVFVHQAFRFEVWLFGYNKGVQARYWKLFKESSWNKYQIPSTTEGVDSIIEGILVGNPDFSDLDTLTQQIERGTLNFIDDIESFLSKY